MPATTDPSDNSGERRHKTRLESEVEEILERAEREQPLPQPTPLRKRSRRPATPQFKSEGIRESGNKVRRWLVAVPLLVAYMFAILAHMFSDISPFITRIAVDLAVLALFWPIVEAFRERQSSSSPARMWRGREINVNVDDGPTPWEQFRQWLRNRRLLP